MLVAEVGGLDSAAATALVTSLPPECGQTIDWDDDDNLVLYSAARLATFPSAPQASAAVDRLTLLGASAVVI